jgi:MscS family membrane protein
MWLSESMQPKPAIRGGTRWLPVVFVLLLATSTVPAQERAHPLQPPDRSSPRATLKTFLDSADAAATFVAQEYLPSPTLEEFRRLPSLLQTPMGCLDLSHLAPSERGKTGRAAGIYLYETLNRIDLPAWDEIPGADQADQSADTKLMRWVIPHTEITLVRAESGSSGGEFLFSADTVARAGAFYERVRGLPYTRPVPLEGMSELVTEGGGWPIRFSWIQAMPAWLRAPLLGNSLWKWIALALLLGFFSILLRSTYRLSLRGGSERPFVQALARLALPMFVLAATPTIAFVALVQINMRWGAASAIELALTVVMFLSGAWLSWRAAPVIAEAIIASPRIAPESVDAYLIRISMRLLALAAVAGLLSAGAGRLGVPVYGIVAGLGVGGVAIALAAQPTIENLIGSLSLFGDKPIRVGDFCKYGDDIGTVESIGIRSTRIRGIDRTLTTIPNGALSKMPIMNFALRDRMLMKTVIGVRYETTPEQLRFLLAKVREMLLGHPRIHPDPARVRFIGFGSSSLDLEVFAYVVTRDWNEFLGIQEDVFLRIMDIVEQSGTAFAFPSQTLYFTRDQGLDDGRVQAAEAQVRQWRDEGGLPFPNFSSEQIERMRGSLVYPPPGSTETPKTSNPEDPELEDTQARSVSAKDKTTGGSHP